MIPDHLTAAATPPATNLRSRPKVVIVPARLWWCHPQADQRASPAVEESNTRQSCGHCAFTEQVFLPCNTRRWHPVIGGVPRELVGRKRGQHNPGWRR